MNNTMIAMAARSGRKSCKEGHRLHEIAQADSAARSAARTVKYHRPPPRQAFAVIQRRGSRRGAE
jgi:hypothetical protein